MFFFHGSEMRQVHQLRLVVYPVADRVLAPSQVVGLGIYEPSTVCFVIPTCFIIFLKSRNLREQKSSYLAILRT